MRALVVIPTYNEAGNIAEALRRVRHAAPAADVLVVDDGSPDGTAQVARACATELGRVQVRVRPGKLGLGSAYREAFADGLRRGYRVLAQMDGDLSHDPAVLPALFRAVRAGADVAVGSRYVPGASIPRWSASRRALSRWGNLYARWLLALPLTDATSGFRAYRAAALTRLDLASVRAEGYGFQIEMAYRVARAGGRFAEVPIAFADRERGESKMSGRIIAEALVLVTGWALRDLTGTPWRPRAGAPARGAGPAPPPGAPRTDRLAYGVNELEITRRRRFAAGDRDLVKIGIWWEQALRQAVGRLPQIRFRAGRATGPAHSPHEEAIQLVEPTAGPDQAADARAQATQRPPA